MYNIVYSISASEVIRERHGTGHVQGTLQSLTEHARRVLPQHIVTQLMPNFAFASNQNTISESRDVIPTNQNTEHRSRDTGLLRDTGHVQIVEDNHNTVFLMIQADH